jgi:hypothetical protein
MMLKRIVYSCAAALACLLAAPISGQEVDAECACRRGQSKRFEGGEA